MKVSTGYAQSSDGEGGRPTSKSSTRSVSGMKTLMPLQLSSPLIPTSRFSDLRATRSISGPGAFNLRSQSFQPSSSCPTNIIGAPSHRDIPVYAPRNSPVLEPAYGTPIASALCSPAPESSSSKVFIINDYELSDCETCSLDTSRNSLDMRADSESLRGNSVLKNQNGSGELSVKGDLNDLLLNEAAWLSSPLNEWNDGRSQCLPYVLSQSMPLRQNIGAWLSDTGSYQEEDDDILACATALSSSKANVIEVNKRQASELSITIPPRSSSLGTTFPETSRISWMTFGPQSVTTDSESLYSDEESLREPEKYALEIDRQAITKKSPTPDADYLLGLESPPPSPRSLSGDSFLHSDLPAPTLEVFLSDHTSPPKHESLHEILSDLENHLGAFPSKMLLDTSNCTTAMRKYLQVRSHSTTPPRPHFDPPPSPALSLDAAFPGAYIQNSAISSRSVNDHGALRFGKGLPPRTVTNTDLEPLRRIFPDTSNFMRSALYAHLLAYIFATSLNSGNNNSSSSPAGAGRKTLGGFRPPSRSIPSKAAELLGMTEQEKVDTETEFEFPSATKALEDLLTGHIDTLVREMERTFDAGKRERGVGKMQLMSLVELVRAIESA